MIILEIVLFITIIVLIGVIALNGDEFEFGLRGYLSFLVIILISVLSIIDGEQSYKEGQIDALNGIIKYELVKQSDGSSEWGRIGDVK